ncbi:MAG: hypothetical protein ACYDEP_07045 [Acidimicrobiales bacterium]
MDLIEICSVHGHVGVLAFDSKRYIGAQSRLPRRWEHRQRIREDASLRSKVLAAFARARSLRRRRVAGSHATVHRSRRVRGTF